MKLSGYLILSLLMLISQICWAKSARFNYQNSSCAYNIELPLESFKITTHANLEERNNQQAALDDVLEKYPHLKPIQSCDARFTLPRRQTQSNLDRSILSIKVIDYDKNLAAAIKKYSMFKLNNRTFYRLTDGHAAMCQQVQNNYYFYFRPDKIFIFNFVCMLHCFAVKDSDHIPFDSNLQQSHETEILQSLKL